MEFPNVGWENYEQYLLTPFHMLYDVLGALFMGAAGYAVWGSVVTMGLVVLAWAYKSRPGRRARLTLQRSIRVSIRRMMPRAGLVARH